MKVGDLVRWRRWVGLIVKKDDWVTLVKWLETGEIEDTSTYDYSENDWEVIRESRRHGERQPSNSF